MDSIDLVAHARDAGWDVTGHRHLRMSRDAVRVEVHYAGETPRIVFATLHLPFGESIRKTIVADRTTPLADVVLRWLAPAILVRAPLAPALTRANGQVAGMVALPA